MKERVVYERKCEQCGVKFYALRKDKIYCSKECVRIACQERKKEKNSEKKPNKQLVKDVKNARKRGLTYGMYIAYKRMGIIKEGK